MLRAAVREYAAQVHRRLEEERERERERELLLENKEILDKQLKALVEEQARR